MDITKTIVGTGTLGLLVYWAIRYFSRPSEKPRFKPEPSYDRTHRNYTDESSRTSTYGRHEDIPFSNNTYRRPEPTNTLIQTNNRSYDDKSIVDSSKSYSSVVKHFTNNSAHGVESTNASFQLLNRRYDNKFTGESSKSYSRGYYKIYRDDKSFSINSNHDVKLTNVIQLHNTCYDNKFTGESSKSSRRQDTSICNNLDCGDEWILPERSNSDSESEEDLSNWDWDYEDDKSSSYSDYGEGLSDILEVPSFWYTNSDDFEEELIPSDPEYQDVESMLKGIPLQNLTGISRIQNSFLYHRYMLRKLEYKSLGIRFSERYLFHASGESNIPSIIDDNLDWRLVKRAKFGIGVSFSPDCRYANTYCNKKIGTKRAMIIATVLVGKKCPGDYDTYIPPKKFDTTTGYGNKVLVKYYDDEFYPEYVVYYTNHRTT